MVAGGSLGQRRRTLGCLEPGGIWDFHSPRAENKEPPLSEDLPGVSGLNTEGGRLACAGAKQMWISLIDRWFNGIMHSCLTEILKHRAPGKQGSVYVLWTCHRELTAAVLTAEVHFILRKYSFS